MTSAQQITQLRHLQAVAFQVGDDGRFFRAEQFRCGYEPLAVGARASRDLDDQPDPDSYLLGLLGSQGAGSRLTVRSYLLLIHISSRTQCAPMATVARYGTRPRRRAPRHWHGR